jgi:hypothetical protein
VVAAVCVGVALYHLDDPPLLLAQLGIACMAGLIAAGVEVAVRTDLRLINNGRAADAIVDSLTPTQRGVRVGYHFFAPDGRMIEGASSISKIDAAVWPIGRRIAIIYDADRPRRHRIQEHVWSVEWEIDEIQ